MIQLKRYNDGQDAIGEWQFELESVGVLPKTEAGLRIAISYILRLAKQLAEDNFFQCTHLRVSRFWVLNPETSESRIEDNPSMVAIEDLQRMIAQEATVSLVADGTNIWFPAGGVMEGKTKILMPREELVLEHAVAVRVAFAGIFAFTLVTDCDAWLSHDLRGRAQPEIRELNLPRLEKALTGMAEALETEAYVEDTQYALMLEGSIESKHEEEGEYHVVEEPDRWVLREWI